MDIQSWASAATVTAVMLTAVGMLARRTDRFHADLKGEIGALRTELKGDIRTSHTELRGDIARLESRTEAGFDRVEARLTGLKQRTFELSARLPPLPNGAT